MSKTLVEFEGLVGDIFTVCSTFEIVAVYASRDLRINIYRRGLVLVAKNFEGLFIGST